MLIHERRFFYAQAAFNIRYFYESTFRIAYTIQGDESAGYQLPLEIHYAVENAIKLATALQAAMSADEYNHHFVAEPQRHRNDVLETLVEIVYEALCSIANRFKGVDDPFWMMGIDAVTGSFPSIGEQPDGFTPFQQRLAVKLIKKLQENMRGFYPALCRVLLSCVGPHHHPSGQPNNTAFNIFKDAMYVELQKLPLLAQSNPDKLGDFLPDHVTYDPGNKALTHVYRDGTQVMTHLGQLALGSVSLTDPLLGRPLTADERCAAERAFL